MRPVSIGGSDRTLGGRTPGGRAARKRLSGGAHRRIVQEELLQHAASLPSGQQLMPAEVVRASGESGASASRTPRSRIPRLIRAKNTPFRAGDARPGTRSGSGRLAPAGDHRLICTIPSFTLIRMRRLIPRRLAAWALAVAVFAAGAAPHRHIGLEDEGAGDKPSQSVLTTHDPLSRAFHWHAVLKIVQEDPCWACHWNRVAGLSSISTYLAALLPGQALALLPPRSALSVARFTRLSRGPPPLL